MKTSSILLCLALILASCSREDDRVKHAVLRPDVSTPGTAFHLRWKDAQFVQDLLASAPTEDTTDAIALAEVTVLDFNEATYVVQDDELVLMHDGGTRIWKSTGIKKRLLTSK